jgi:hypothetical protein
MDDLYKYIYFYTLDYTGNYTTSSYTLPITPFTFIPVFKDGTNAVYSSQLIHWDFGDGTYSNSVTATHYYSVPGWYNVKCYVLGTSGIGYEDKFSQSILVKDFISDTIVLSGSNNKTEAGSKQNPFEVYRFNSWQSYDPENPVDYTINLNVSGNNSPFLDVNDYSKDKWGHLKPSARFETETYDSYSGTYSVQPVNKLNTSNTELYIRKNLNNELVFCKKSDPDSCFVGTSGSKMFYYIDDIPKKIDKLSDAPATTVFVTFDTLRFKDFDSFNKNYPTLEYPVINNILDTNSFSVLMQQLNSDRITITSNGIDTDGYGNPIDTFNIYQEKFTGQKIPFVVRIKDKYGIASKGNPILNKVDVFSLTGGEINITLRDSSGEIIEGIQFYSNFGVLSTEKYGGYYKGYFISNKQLENVHLHAVVIPYLYEEYLCNTTYAIINEPQYEKVHNVRVKQVLNESNKTLEDKLYNVTGLSGVYSSCVVTQRKVDGTVSTTIWLVDGDRDKIVKYDENFNVVYDNFVLPENSSPSDIASDSKGNVWVTLYDSISVIKINDITNALDTQYTIVSELANEIINYENTITPASIDTDYLDNVWVSYSNPLSSFIEKYNSVGNLLFRKVLDSNYQITDLTTDLNLNLWAIMKDKTTTSNILSSKNDKVVKINSDGDVVEYYEVGGSLWNITTDVYRHIWLTRNINEVTKINTLFDTISSFKLSTHVVNDSKNYISDLEGIACTTDNNIIVIDNTNKKLHYFDSDIEIVGFNSNSLSLESQSTPLTKIIQKKLNGYGDWNGFKYINKHQHIFSKTFSLETDSNTFSIYEANSGKYDLRKLNENFDPKAQINAYRFQEYLQDKNVLFDDFIGTVVGDNTSKPTSLGKLIYEKISNFVDNNSNIDICNTKALYSMYQMFDEELYRFNNTDYDFPADLNRLVEIFSINFSKLKGSRNKFDQNFTDRGYNSQEILKNGGSVIYGNNKGQELNFFTTVLTAGKAIIAYEKFSKKYTLINTKLLSSSYIEYVDPIKELYPLSAYNSRWGWDLVLPDDYTRDKMPYYYTFYEYISGYLNIQNEGVINWGDTYTTINENLTSIEDWEEIKNNMITYSLAKGLGIIK